MNTKANTKFKQAVVGGALAALTLGSMSAQAMRISEVGEAQLVPFVLWDSTPICIFPGAPPSAQCPTGGIAAPLGFLGINTAVKITVPKADGNDVIPNSFTATHTSPTNDPSCTPPGNPAVAGCEHPADADLLPGNQIHWFFLDQNSLHLLNGRIPVTPEDVAVIDWGATVRQNGQQGSLDGVPGYLVLTTEEGARGNDADFGFFAEAWMFIGLDGPAGPPNTGGVVGLVDALIPTLAMNDAADQVPTGNEVPSLANNVIEIGVNLNVNASPLVTGIRTNWSDGNPSDIKVVDLTLGNRSIPIAGVVNILQVPTLMVVWNDRNAAAWNAVGVEVYNDREENCSTSIALPNELNLVWVQTDVTAGNLPGIPAFPIPRFIERFGIDRTFCVPPAGADPGENLERLLSGGFMKLYLPEPVDNGVFQPESSAAMFSIPLQYFVTLEDIGAGPVLTDFSLIPFATALGHDRGMFNVAP